MFLKPALCTHSLSMRNRHGHSVEKIVFFLSKYSLERRKTIFSKLCTPKLPSMSQRKAVSSVSQTCDVCGLKIQLQDKLLLIFWPSAYYMFGKSISFLKIRLLWLASVLPRCDYFSCRSRVNSGLTHQPAVPLTSFKKYLFA
jgi:hypothetical protein